MTGGTHQLALCLEWTLLWQRGSTQLPVLEPHDAPFYAWTAQGSGRNVPGTRDPQGESGSGTFHADLTADPVPGPTSS